MKISDLPARFNVPFADAAGGGFVRTIPEASQIGVQNGAASLTTGFPPLTFLPVGAGGTPPFGQDMNGILKQVTQWSRWQGAGGMAPFNASFSTAIGGYPKYSIVPSVPSADKFYMSAVDDNTTDPDSGGSAGWITFDTVDATTVINAYIAGGRPAQTAPYFVAKGVAAGATYVNNVISISSDMTLQNSHFLDPGTTFSGGKLTVGPLDAGIWQFSGNVGLNTAQVNWSSKVSLLKNGSILIGYSEVYNSGTPVTGNGSVSGCMNLASGDDVAVYMQQNFGSNQTSSPLGTFSGSRVGV